MLKTVFVYIDNCQIFVTGTANECFSNAESRIIAELTEASMSLSFYTQMCLAFEKVKKLIRIVKIDKRTNPQLRSVVERQTFK